ncbi:hypothetical protein AGOR_G00027970 [Albula goreensis]|uniref:X-ray radiation resistance-associated protein 1 n=1 Tax=Albula goreensis TaxID=1534307 RepID=A0A8T3E698_9TELE|nr:hypothetical protein AGOR_G00027970 [Albula goreensis]
MSTSGLYKLDEGEACITNCFPVRSFFQLSKEGAGHWLVAHRNAVEQKHKRSWSRKPQYGAQYTPESVVSGSTKPQDSSKTDTSSNILDGFLLMRLHGVDKPSELCNVNIIDQKLHSAKTEDFEEFDSVAYINASENHLNLEVFTSFPVLRELELSLNGLYHLRVNAGDFPHLEILDLSYNSLCSDDVLSLGLLPCLKVLHLTGNDLQKLPDNMAAPHHASTQLTLEQDVHFSSLEVLMLDDNKLCSPGVFNSLAHMKSLQHLNLQGNNITEVPYLQQFEDAQDLQHNEDLGHREMLISGPHTLATNNQSVQRTDIQDVPGVQKQHIMSSDGEDCIHPSCSSFQVSSEFHLPLPELRTLNLADNKIAVEEALLAVALFPSLSQLVIHSNPLTTQRSGDPPMLTHFLQDRLGITIQRKKIPQFVKPRIMIPVNPKRKVVTKIQKVPKLPLKVEAAANIFLCDQSSFLENSEDFKEKSIPPECKSLQSMSSQGPEDAEEVTAKNGDLDEDAFFITQVNEGDEPVWCGKSENLEPDYEEQREEDFVPEKFRGYEILLDAKPDPDMVEPVGIQQTVQALELALKNLLVYRDSKAHSDHHQNPYSEKKKSIGNLPPTQPRRLNGHKAEDALTKMKNRKTINKVPLDKVLKSKEVYKKEYEEAQTLLRDMREKYQTVYIKAGEGPAVTESHKLTALEK